MHIDQLLVKTIGRRPIAVSDAEADYAISIVCRGEVEAHIRELESSNIEDRNRVEVSAAVRADSRQDRLLEQIVGRLSLEPLVMAARWRLDAVE